MEKNSKIYVAGHTGLAGSSIMRELQRKGYNNIVTKTHAQLDLTINWDTKNFFAGTYPKPEYVFLCAARVGGVLESITKPVDLLVDNIRIQTNVITACHQFGVKKLLNLGSSCIYPVDGEQPYKEEQLGHGRTDENWSYAVAKIASIELCRAYHRQYGCNFLSVIPCNIYGPGDNFDLNKAHVIPALIRKFHEDEQPITIWGDGLPLREFLYIDDFAEASVMLMEKYDYNDLCEGVINIGSGYDIDIHQLALMIQDNVKQKVFIFDDTKPSGVPSKLMDSTRINKLGWKPKASLEDGIEQTYGWWLGNNR